jgi:hypothetical protein
LGCFHGAPTLAYPEKFAEVGEKSGCAKTRGEVKNMTKRGQVADHFRAHLHEPQNSAELHNRFGSSLRTRISEINNDPDGDLVIKNYTYSTGRAEISIYTASPRHSLFGNISKWHDPEER